MDETLVVTIKNTKAFQEGAVRAAQNILNPVQSTRAVNPYPKNSQEHTDWVLGYSASACEM